MNFPFFVTVASRPEQLLPLHPLFERGGGCVFYPQWTNNVSTNAQKWTLENVVSYLNSCDKPVIALINEPIGSSFEVWQRLFWECVRIEFPNLIRVCSLTNVELASLLLCEAEPVSQYEEMILVVPSQFPGVIEHISCLNKEQVIVYIPSSLSHDPSHPILGASENEVQYYSSILKEYNTATTNLGGLVMSSILIIGDAEIDGKMEILSQRMSGNERFIPSLAMQAGVPFFTDVKQVDFSKKKGELRRIDVLSTFQYYPSQSLSQTVCKKDRVLKQLKKRFRYEPLSISARLGLGLPVDMALVERELHARKENYGSSHHHDIFVQRLALEFSCTERFIEKALERPMSLCEGDDWMEDIGAPIEEVTVLTADPRAYDIGWTPKDHIEGNELRLALLDMPYKVVFFDNHHSLLHDWVQSPPDFVYLLCDEGLHNKNEFELNIASFLEILGVPFTGSGPTSVVLTGDKDIISRIAQQNGIHVPNQVSFSAQTANSDSILPSISALHCPLMVKLSNSGGSMGISESSFCSSYEAATAQVLALGKKYPSYNISVQEFLSGAEYSVGIIGNECDNTFRVLPPIEISFDNLIGKPPLQTWEGKSDPDGVYGKSLVNKPAILSQEDMSYLEMATKRICGLVGLNDYARFDFRRGKNGKLYLLDVNPNNWVGGKYKLMGEMAGYTWSKLLAEIVRVAMIRQKL